LKYVIHQTSRVLYSGPLPICFYWFSNSILHICLYFIYCMAMSNIFLILKNKNYFLRVNRKWEKCNWRKTKVINNIYMYNIYSKTIQFNNVVYQNLDFLKFLVRYKFIFFIMVINYYIIFLIQFFISFFSISGYKWWNTIIWSRNRFTNKETKWSS